MPHPTCWTCWRVVSLHPLGGVNGQNLQTHAWTLAVSREYTQKTLSYLKALTYIIHTFFMFLSFFVWFLLGTVFFWSQWYQPIFSNDMQPFNSPIGASPWSLSSFWGGCSPEKQLPGVGAEPMKYLWIYHWVSHKLGACSFYCWDTVGQQVQWQPGNLLPEVVKISRLSRVIATPLTIYSLRIWNLKVGFLNDTPVVN